MNSIFTRRSVRTFSNQPVEADKLDKLLRAAMQAPSARNQQPWEFIVVRGRENLVSLSKFARVTAALETADLGIIVLFNKKRVTSFDYWQQDLGAATQNILLQATELGLGTVWLGGAPNEDKAGYISKMYDLSEDLVPYCVIAVGYPEIEDANKFVDRFDESRISYID